MARSDLVVTDVPHRELTALLASDPIVNVCAAYLAGMRPDAMARAAVVDGVARAALVGGAHHGVVAAYHPWLLGTSDAAVHELLADLGGAIPNGLQLRAEHAAAVHVVHEAATLEAEVMLRCTRPDSAIGDGRADVKRLGDVRAKGIAIDDELRALVGNPDDFARDAPFWCLVEEHRVVALADTIARAGETVAIQQVYTVESQRRRGLGATLIRAVIDRHPRGTRFVWLTGEANVASRALAGKLGFEEHAKVRSLVLCGWPVPPVRRSQLPVPP